MSKHRHQRGQGMTEYIVIVAVVAIAVYSLLGKAIRNQTAAIATELAGQSAGESINEAKSSADKARSDAATDRTLSTYHDNAARAGGK
ncbi:MAG: hypothetical protein MO853_13525 [Candidatus Protistobacter heckmanni]|nr:hypothetical protein [Candidatus Protistobacter heckmanni]